MSQWQAQMLEQAGDIGLMAVHAVERFREHHVELAALRVLDKRLNARSQDHAGARERGVIIDADNLPLLPRRMLTAGAPRPLRMTAGQACRYVGSP
jgi:hypothetical protein